MAVPPPSTETGVDLHRRDRVLRGGDLPHALGCLRRVLEAERRPGEAAVRVPALHHNPLQVDRALGGIPRLSHRPGTAPAAGAPSHVPHRIRLPGYHEPVHGVADPAREAVPEGVADSDGRFAAHPIRSGALGTGGRHVRSHGHRRIVVHVRHAFGRRVGDGHGDHVRAAHEPRIPAGGRVPVVPSDAGDRLEAVRAV